MNNSEMFLNSFSAIENYLERYTKTTGHDSFANLVKKASHNNSVIRQYKTDLFELKDLRNAIVHERTDGHVIAEPHDGVVKLIKKIEGLLKDPPGVIPTFKGEVVTLDIEDSLRHAVRIMKEKSFTQIPILKNNKYFDLLTTNTVVRWIGSSAVKNISIPLNVQIEEVLKCKESNNICQFISQELNFFDVLELFDDYKNSSKKLEALIITPDGHSNEVFLGIITHRDLPTIYDALENY